MMLTEDVSHTMAPGLLAIRVRSYPRTVDTSVPGITLTHRRFLLFVGNSLRFRTNRTIELVQIYVACSLAAIFLISQNYQSRFTSSFHAGKIDQKGINLANWGNRKPGAR